MLKSVKLADSASTSRFIRLWSARYLPDLSALPAQKGEFPVAELVEVASEEQRSQTANKIKRILHLSCELAGLEANSLFSYIPNIVNLAEARRMAQYVECVYDKAFLIYKQQQPPSYFLKFIDSSSDLFSKIALPSLMLPMICTLAEELEPSLLQLQQQHLSSKDPRTIGFLTTHFHFSTRELFKQLNRCEQVLVTPYLKFIEEQACIPWQRICAIAAHYPPNSLALSVVEQLLPLSHDIATAVYQRALATHSQHRSRRGKLDHPGVRASTLRDLHMFQGYLWLCVLEGNMTAIEHELLPLCVAVFPSVEVKWDLVRQMVRLLTLEVQARINPEQQQFLQSYLQALQDIFALPKLGPISSYAIATQGPMEASG